ncbi:heterogeneous nuclear ribonucleoprotein A0 [Trifolium repens]|nr:heterogeneous nuclear ribonucleoprotein A0 [Trifolium repens]
MGWDDGEWTEVRRRRRKVLRHRDTDIDSCRQSRRSRIDNFSLSHRSISFERRTRFYPSNRDRRFRQKLYPSRFVDLQQHDSRDFDPDHHAPARDLRHWLDAGGRQRWAVEEQYTFPRFGEDRQQSQQVMDMHQQRWAVEKEKPNTFPRLGEGRQDQLVGGSKSNTSGRQRYVSFYFTNFPVQLSLFYLRKGFEVCGILEDIYVARKRNKQGQPYGFVRFSNVRDIPKLTKALNAVCFGDFRVRARVARFDRNNVSDDEPPGDGVEAGVLGADKAVDKPIEQPLRLDGVTPRVAVKQRCETLAVTANGLDAEEGVRVGDVMVRLGKVDRPESNKQEDMKHEEPATGEGKDPKTYVRSYKAAPDDVNWARSGVVATIANGEAGSVVRRRLEDAGFKGLDLIHLGGARFLFGARTGQRCWLF